MVTTRADSISERQQRRRRSGNSRMADGATTGATAAAATSWQMRNPFPPIALFSADQIEAIHEASLTILEEMGVKILHDEARAFYKAAGAEVDEAEHRVRLDRELVMSAVGNAPEVVRLQARNPAHDVEIGGNAIAVATVGGPPNCSDMAGGRRPGSLADLSDFMRLAQSFDVIQVLKLNTVEDFQTGIYDYNLMTSSWTALQPAPGRPLPGRRRAPRSD